MKRMNSVWYVRLRATIVLGAALFSSALPAQQYREMMDDPNQVFEDVVDEADSWLSDPANNATNGQIKEFSRWASYWGARTDQDGTTKTARNHAWARWDVNAVSLCDGNPFNSDWSSIGPFTTPGAIDHAPGTVSGRGQGMIWRHWVHPSNHNFILAASNSSGLFRTTDGGNTWENLMDHLKVPNLGIQGIACDAGNTNHIVVYTGNTANYGEFGVGVIETTNGGITWEQIGPDGTNYDPNTDPGRGLLMDPSDPQVLYAFKKEELKITTDGGLTWVSTAPSGPGLPSGDLIFTRMEFKPGDPSIIYVIGRHVWIYDVDLDSWTEITPPASLISGATNFDAGDIAVSADDDDLLFVYALTTGSVQQLLKYSYANQTWTSIGGISGASNIAPRPKLMEIEVSQHDVDIIYIGGIYFNRSTDGGQTWASMGSSGNHLYNSVVGSPLELHLDVRWLDVLPGPGQTDLVYVGHDGGLSLGVFDNNTDASNLVWQDLNGTGLSATQAYDLSISPTCDLIVSGLQDIGLYKRRGGEWYVVKSSNIPGSPSGGDGMTVQTDPEKPGKLWGTILSGQVSFWSSDDAGDYWDEVLENQPYLGYLDYPFVLEPGSPDNFYFATDDIWHYDATGSSNPTQFTSFSEPGEIISALAVAESDPEVIYVGYHRSSVNKAHVRYTNNGGALWNDVYLYNTPTTLHPKVTDIVIDPDDPNNVWISLGHWEEDKKVFRMLNGVLTDVSDGLPDVPVISLVYQEGSNDVVYAGTDVGVYVWDANAQAWKCFSHNLPPYNVADLEINYCTGKLVASLYGRGVWESPLAEPPAQASGQVIFQNTLWDTDRYLSTDLVIQSGQTLTIDGAVVRISTGKKIYVQQGASLILENKTTLTSACGDLWGGIEVWGDRNKPQLPQQSGPQGYLRVDNSTIEFAKTAVTLWRSGHWDNTGGIIRATDSWFKNNWRSIEFMSYHNVVSGTQTRNASYIKDCKFWITDKFRFHANFDPYAHITMYDVEGVSIWGSEFKNFFPDNYSFPEVGIVLLDAELFLDEYCTTVSPCPTSQRVGNRFHNLREGVFVSNHVKPFTVIGATFDHCAAGVFVNETTGANLERNNFNDCHVGVFLSKSSGFKVEENTFSSQRTDARGIVAFQTGTSGNRLYRNEFEDIFNGISAQGIQGGSNFGLQLQCNRFKGNNPNSDIGVSSGSLAPQQGMCDPVDVSGKLLAGNEFSHTCANAEADALVDHTTAFPASGFVYHHHQDQGTVRPTCIDISVGPQDCGQVFDRNNACPQEMADPFKGLEGKRKIDWEEDIDHWGAQKIAAQEDYASLVDGGETTTFLESIGQGGAFTSQDIFDLLVPAVPYLSDAVMIACLERSPRMNDEHLHALLLENSPLEPEVMAALNNLTPTMDVSLKNEIAEAQSGISARKVLENGILFASQKRDIALHGLTNYFKTDTIDSIVDPNDSIYSLWINEPGMRAQANLLALEVERGNFQAASDHRQTLSSDPEWAELGNLYDMIITSRQNGTSLLEAANDPAWRTVLEGVANEGELVGAGYAQAIMDFVDFQIQDVLLEPLNPDPAARKSVEPVKERFEAGPWKTYPNPSDGRMTFEWSFPDGVEFAAIEVFDLRGLVVHHSMVFGKDGKQLVDLSRLAPGAYLAQMRHPGLDPVTVKVIIGR